MFDVVVIGGGLNGLVAGAWLAKRRFKTTIVDARPSIGGAAITSEIAPGFRVPALSHSLGPLHKDVVRAFDFDRASTLQAILPDPALTTLAGDRHIVFHRDPVLTAASIHHVSPHDAGQWQKFLQSAHRVSSVIAALQRHEPPSIDRRRSGDLWRLAALGWRARSLGSRDLARLLRWMPMSVADVAAEWFDDDLMRAAIGARGIFGNPVGPRSAGTGAMLLQRLADDPMPFGSGATVRGGPGVLSEAIAAVAQKAGARIVTGARVASVICRHGRTVGVALADGTEIEARAVVSAIDPKQTFLKLVDPTEMPPSFLEQVQRIRARGVTAKINLALSAMPDFPALHGDAVPLRGRLLIAPSPDYLERAHDASKYGEIAADPWLEIAMPSVADPSLAPSGAHVMSIYAQTAPRQLRSGTWAAQKTQLVDRVLRVLEPHAPNLKSLVVAQDTITPEDLETAWGATGGHIFHGEPTIDQFWVARPVLGWSQYKTPVEGLFLASAGAHPGGGLTGLPGLLAARAVVRAVK